MSAQETVKIDLIALENEVSLYEQKLRDLKLQKSILSSQKTTATSCGKTQKELSNLDDMLFSVMESENMDLQNLHLENVHRLTGITAFDINKHQGFGIRFELFRNDLQFDTPHYIIFKKDSKGKLSLYKHTLPAFVPLKRLARQYLRTDLMLFVCKVRSALYQHIFKQQLFLSGLPGVMSIQVDPAFSLVKLILRDDKGTLLLSCNQTHVEKALLESVTDGGRTWANSLVGPLTMLPARLSELVGDEPEDVEHGDVEANSILTYPADEPRSEPQEELQESDISQNNNIRQGQEATSDLGNENISDSDGLSLSSD